MTQPPARIVVCAISDQSAPQQHVGEYLRRRYNRSIGDESSSDPHTGPTTSAAGRSSNTYNDMNMLPVPAHREQRAVNAL
jgi:hypothetical protein